MTNYLIHFKAMLDDAGIHYEIESVDSAQIITIKKCRDQDDEDGPLKIAGYEGFFTSFIFDEDGGALLRVEIFE